MRDDNGERVLNVSWQDSISITTNQFLTKPKEIMHLDSICVLLFLDKRQCKASVFSSSLE